MDYFHVFLSYVNVYQRVNPWFAIADTKVKLEKVDIMCMLVSDKNFDQVLLELKEWPGEHGVFFPGFLFNLLGPICFLTCIPITIAGLMFMFIYTF